MKAHNLSIIFYLSSLMLPSLSNGSERIMYGIELLVYGFMGASLVLISTVDSSFSDTIGMFILMIPWLANFSWLASIILIIKGKKNSNITKRCSYFSLGAVLFFYVNPQAPLGADMDIVKTNILIGNYLWILAMTLPFLSTWLAGKQIN